MALKFGVDQVFGNRDTAFGNLAENFDLDVLRGKLAASDLEVKTELSASGIFKNFGGIRSGSVPERYREFLFKAKDVGMAEFEQLVPYIEIPSGAPSAVAYCDERDDADGARDLLSEFPPSTWGYYLPLSKDYSTLGKKTELDAARELSRKRSEYRLNFIFRGLEAMLGRTPGSGLGGSSILDVACNWGGFSIEAKLRGAGQVTGFDIRPENVAKASRVLDHYGLEQVRFEQQDLFGFTPDRTFDVVLNLGLMYHISMPFEMMRKTYELTGDIAIIDTIVHKECFSGFVLGTGELGIEHANTAIGIELHPTYRGLLDLAYLVGFRHVVELRGLPDPGWTGFESDHYGSGTRRCIACIK